MVKILLDTSVFIEMSRTGSGIYLEILNEASQTHAQLQTSVIVVAEFWAGQSLNITANARQAETLFADIDVVEIDEPIAKEAGVLRRSLSLHIADALIAATALKEGARLATLHTKHFANIPDLKLWG